MPGSKPRFPLVPVTDGAVTRLLRKDGVVALIDTEDLSKVMGHSWRLYKDPECSYLVTGHKHTQMARVIIDVPPGRVPDHRNGDGLDNRKQNLRACTQGQNRCNVRKMMTRPTSSIYKGVCRRGHKYEAAIALDGIRHGLGMFHEEIAAAKAYDAKARELHGEFARLNFPEAA